MMFLKRIFVIVFVITAEKWLEVAWRNLSPTLELPCNLLSAATQQPQCKSSLLQLQLPANKASSKINPNNLPQKKSFTKNFKIVNYQIMPPKPRTLSVSKQCEECGGSSPVACKSCKISNNDLKCFYFIFINQIMFIPSRHSMWCRFL